MTVDQKNRDLLATLFQEFLDCKIDNYKYDDESMAIAAGKSDTALWEIWWITWEMYDDFRNHKLEGKFALSTRGKEFSNRIILFLRSDLEYKWPKIQTPFQLLDLFMSVLTFGIWAHYVRKARNIQRAKIGDERYWPFLNENDFIAQVAKDKTI